MDNTTDKRSIGASTKRGVKVAISLLCYSGAELARGVMRLTGRTPAPRLVVLCYHEVPEQARTRFARQMRALARGTTVVRAADNGPLPDGGSCVAITFDDAFRSVRVNAVPELLGRGFPATIFVPVDFLGKEAGWEMRNGVINGVNDPVMTCEELLSLPDVIEFGSHSLSHPGLTKLDGVRLREEVTTSRHKLAELLGRHVSLFACPYGEYDDRVIGTCRQAGYERVFACAPWPADPAGRDFVRGRVLVDEHDGPLMFYLKMRGAYGWMVHASALKRRLARWRRSQ
jgi:peptidoglycan/xylan/chitin deacetylase (PgdA/CDA1 family)